ncbi:cation diffusion facilitator family transporter [Naviculisporaceae sp. PSN 640]
MGWSKSTRIKVMLALDIAFFVLELSVGIYVKSLALMADAFHMLNDIISLLVGLWAVSVARKATTDRYSYGWLRAEILGAFFNAVFLIALCVSIIIEAFTRFLDPPEISNARLILYVGCAGLTSNLVGFFVLGGHGHSHGPGDHSHGDGHSHGEEHTHSHGRSDIQDAEEGRANVRDENGSGIDILPAIAVDRYAQPQQTPPSLQNARTRTPVSSRHTRLTSIEDMAIHPASFRQDIIDASRATEEDSSTPSDSGADEEAIVGGPEASEDSPLLSKDNRNNNAGRGYGARSSAKHQRRSSEIHRGHKHNHPRKAGSSGHGHNHADMGMDAMILHVIGDALGNVGVIATALIIELTRWSWRYYADPAVSLFITLIILKTAVPLTLATARILLQATPENIEIANIKADIEGLDNVESCHHIHVWQLSDSQIVASLHILVKFPMSDTYAKQYMQLAREVRKCLHGYGIHSATIQPEFCLDMSHVHGREVPVSSVDGPVSTRSPTATCDVSEENVCLMECVDGCVAQGCCKGAGSRPESRHSSRRSTTNSHDDNHDHEHGHGHSH